MDDSTHEGARRQVNTRIGGRRFSRFDRRHRLTSQDSFVAFQLHGLDQTDIGRDEITHAKLDDVTRYQVPDIDSLGLLVSPHERLVMDVGVQRRDGDLGAVLVDEPETDAEHHDRGDDPTISRIAGCRGHGRRGEKQDQQRVAELAA